jgi:hypothetical protein
MNIVFLHIPKTAGQSVHHYLISNFDEKSIFPARVNEQAIKYTVEEIKKYKIFSGHFDISLLDVVNQPKFVFTILRKPIDRILSYYFYLRSEAKKLSSEELNTSKRQGMKAALELSPDEYFCDENISIRQFIDNHYNNFYMYYFAMKSYNGKSFADQLIKKQLLSIDTIYDYALTNLSQINAIYDISNWGALSTDLSKILPHQTFEKQEVFVNKGDGNDSIKRLESLMALGATQKTLDKINDFCKYDNLIYEKFCKNK